MSSASFSPSFLETGYLGMAPYKVPDNYFMIPDTYMRHKSPFLSIFTGYLVFFKIKRGTEKEPGRG